MPPELRGIRGRAGPRGAGRVGESEIMIKPIQTKIRWRCVYIYIYKMIHKGIKYINNYIDILHIYIYTYSLVGQKLRLLSFQQ